MQLYIYVINRYFVGQLVTIWQIYIWASYKTVSILYPTYKTENLKCILHFQREQFGTKFNGNRINISEFETTYVQTEDRMLSTII
jgi:glutathione peroxidase-family protein